PPAAGTTTGAPAKADPALYARAVAHPSQSFSVILREATPGSTTAENLVRSLGGRVTHELRIAGGFSATVPGSAVPALTSSPAGMDRFGHGTHMAGILVGDGTSSNGTWTGVAPQANLVSIKVAGLDGSTDVSIVMAGLQWAVTHRADYNIRVLNLSFGTDSK